MDAPRRKILSFSRDLEFANEAELAKRMGCARPLWLRAAVKELIDNSLDSCEEAEIAPEIAVDADGVGVTVTDNGPGMASELIELLCDRTARTSSREAYAAPDRGAQGNALQILMALPLGLGCNGAITCITSRGVRHRITLRVNRLAGRIDLEREATPVEDEPGTAVELVWPGVVDCGELADLIHEFAGFNPHVRFTLPSWPPWEGATWEPAGPIAKWTPGRPTPIHWYPPDLFEHRILLELRRDPEITVAQFVGSFASLTDRSKRARIAAAAGLQYQRLGVLLATGGTALRPLATQMLREAMLAEARAPNPSVLGAVGKESLESWLGATRLEGAQRVAKGFAYHMVVGVNDAGIPWRWEVGFAHLPDAKGRELLVGQNFSPAIDPTAMLNAAVFWLPAHLYPGEPIMLVAHRISPARQTLDYGKTRLTLGPEEADALREAIRKVAGRWIKLRKREERGHGTPGRRDLETPPPALVSIRDAVWQELPAAYARASSAGAHPVRARQVYYAIRPRILELLGRETFGDAYFSAKLLPEFLRAHPELSAGWRVLFDPRGTLTEPHTNRTVPLGTAAVAAYLARWTDGVPFALDGLPAWEAETVGPRNRFAAVAAAEKEGIADLLLADGVGSRWDLAIVGGKGHATEAAYALADRLNLPLFVLHDFDRAGLVIGDNLRHGTWRHRYANRFPVIDVGLRLHQAAELESEPIDEKNRDSISDERLRRAGASAAELEFLSTRRVELNAQTTAQLVGMLEAALVAHKVKKVIPTTEDLANAWRVAEARAEVCRTIARANRKAQRWADEAPPADLADQVRALLEGDRTIAWDAAIRTIVEG